MDRGKDRKKNKKGGQTYTRMDTQMKRSTTISKEGQVDRKKDGWIERKK